MIPAEAGISLMAAPLRRRADAAVPEPDQLPALLAAVEALARRVRPLGFVTVAIVLSGGSDGGKEMSFKKLNIDQRSSNPSLSATN
jgi:hypothetical protein